MRSKGFFYNLAGFVSEYFATVGEFERLLQSFVSIRFSQHDRIVLHVIQRARAQAPLHLPHKFFDVKVFTKSFPFSQLLSPNLAKTLLVLAPHMLF